MSEQETSAEIEAAAADWAVRVEDAALHPEEQAALDAWLAANARRRGAFARAQAVLLHTQRAKALGPDFDADAYIAAHRENGAGVPFSPAATPIAHPSRRRFLIAGGSAAAAVAASALIMVDLPARPDAYATDLGEVRLVPLKDGSGMTLNTASHATVHYSRGERHIELTEGEAMFDVAKDSHRPFTVVAGNTEVRAVGTSFTVQHLPGKPVEVLVREGIVEIRSLTDPGRPPRRVAANARAVAPAAKAMEVSHVAPAELGRELAWREGMLSFEDVSLARAAEQFSRYSARRIQFADQAIGRETVTGLFRANDPDGFARAAALSLGLETEVTESKITLAKHR